MASFQYSVNSLSSFKIWDTDLNLIKTLDSHEAYIYAIVANSSGKIYSSSCDGLVKFMEAPFNNENVKELLRCDDVIQSMYCDGDILYTGDDKGVVTKWENDKIFFKYNLVEEVKTLAANGSLIYTARNLDMVVSEIVAGKSGKYATKFVFPGKSPLALLGPILDGRKSYLAFPDRTGKSLILFDSKKFTEIWTLPVCFFKNHLPV